MAADSSKVEIPKSALYGLVGVSCVSLLALMFLLGRMTAPAPPPPPAPPPLAAAPQPGSPETPITVPMAIEPVAIPTPSESSPAGPVAAPPRPQLAVRDSYPRGHEVAPSPSGHTTVTVTSHRSPVDAATRKQVKEYLAQVDALAAGSQDMDGDLNSFATKILGQMSSGDTSGFDDLIRSARQAQAGLAKIHPPAVCKEHYQLLSNQMSASVRLLEQVKKASVDLDTAALTTLATQGQKMQGAARHLEELTNRLRSRFS